MDGVDVAGLDEGLAARRAPLGRHDLPALQPALVPHGVRQCRAAARDRGRRQGADRAGRSSRCSTSSASPTSATAIRPNCPAARSSASASPGRSPPSPTVLLCDEATSALDPETTSSILQLLASVNAELGLTILLITHEMPVIKEICDRVAVLEAGRIVEEGDVFDVLTRPRHPTTRAASWRPSPGRACRPTSPSRCGRSRSPGGRPSCASPSRARTPPAPVISRLTRARHRLQHPGGAHRRISPAVPSAALLVSLARRRAGAVGRARALARLGSRRRRCSAMSPEILASSGQATLDTLSMVAVAAVIGTAARPAARRVPGHQPEGRALRRARP